MLTWLRSLNWNWSFRAFTIFGIEVRIHWTLVAFYVGTLAHLFDRNEVAWTLGYGAAFLSLLWLSILLHEFGHCFAARARGISADEVLLWPLGGLAMIGSEGTFPQHEVFIAAAGPAVSLACAVVFAILAAIQAPVLGWDLLNPFSAWTPTDWGWVDFGGILCKNLAKANLIMVAFNVFVPAFPLDGGRILRGLLRPRVGFERATRICTTVAFVAAAALAVIGVIGRDLGLVAIALFVVLQARHERALLAEGADQGQTFLGHDFSMGYTSLAAGDAADRPADPRRRGPGFAARIARLVNRPASAPEPTDPDPPPPPRPRETLREQVDRLLTKVSASGLASLSPEERRFLEEASRRFGSGERDRPV